MVSVRDRPKFQGLIGVFIGIGSIIGPLAGGLISDYASWRICFYMNVPICVGALILNMVFLKVPRHPEDGEGGQSWWSSLKKYDSWGTLVLVGFIVAFFTPLQLGGSTWAWNSEKVIVLFCLSAVFLVGLGYVERHDRLTGGSPILPPRIFANVSAVATMVISFCVSALLVSLIFLSSLVFQVVYGDTGRWWPTVGWLIKLTDFVLQYFCSYSSRYCVPTLRYRSCYCDDLHRHLCIQNW
jgi:MFS family permease